MREEEEAEYFSWDGGEDDEITSLEGLRCLTRLELSERAVLPGEGLGTAHGSCAGQVLSLPALGASLTAWRS